MNTQSIDLGAGNIKRVGDHSHIIIATQIAAATGLTMGRVAGMRNRRPPTTIEVAGHKFYVGAGSHEWGRPIENLDDSRFTVGTPELRALVYATLSDIPDATQPLTVVVALPQSALAEDVAGQTTTGLRRWLTGTHTWRCDDTEHTVEIARVIPTTQVAGAYFDYLLDDNGEYIPERKTHYKQEVGIMSIGMNNIEMMVVNRGQRVPRFTVSTTNGVRRLLELINGNGLYSRGELDCLLRENNIDIAASLPLWASDITGDVEKGWGGKTRKRFAVTYIIGGGAVLLGSTLYTMFNGKTLVADDPILAVARGIKKLAKRKSW